MSQNIAFEQILIFIASIFMHFMVGYFLFSEKFKFDRLPEISIKVTLIEEALLEASSSIKEKINPEKKLEKASDIIQQKISDVAPQKFDKSDENSAVIKPSYNAEILNNMPPAYPALARRLGQEGMVTLQVLVLASGKAASVNIIHSSGSRHLDEAALNAIQKWHFIPAKKAGHAIDYYINVPITFELSKA